MLTLKWDQRFESAFLMRGVRNEPSPELMLVSPIFRDIPILLGRVRIPVRHPQPANRKPDQKEMPRIAIKSPEGRTSARAAHRCLSHSLADQWCGETGCGLDRAPAPASTGKVRICLSACAASRNTKVRKPSHLGSNCHPSPSGKASAALDNIGARGGAKGRRMAQYSRSYLTH